MILTRSEIAEFTGYLRPGKQIAWLRRHGLRFFVAADGHPRVLRTDLEVTARPRARVPALDSLGKPG